jgi:hypothetical protein
MRRYQLRRHLYFVHRSDDDTKLAIHGIKGHLIEELCSECKGTAYEYKQTRKHFEDYCTRYETDSNIFHSFLELNSYYERQMQEKESILGLNLFEEHLKLNETMDEPDDDKWIIKKARAREVP